MDNKMIDGSTLNITPDGMSITCDEPLPLDELFRFFIVPEAHENIDVTGKVVWSDFYGVDENDTSVGIGICFVEISEKDSHFFNDIISAQDMNERPGDAD
jgi:Tfp pilus assembly protein PilZ